MAAVIKPLADKVLVKVVEEEEKTPGGIYLPDTAKEKPFKGRVVAVGTGKQLKDGRIVSFDALGAQARRHSDFQQVCGHRNQTQRRKAHSAERGRHLRCGGGVSA